MRRVLVEGYKIGRAAHQPGMILGDRVQHFGGGIAGCQSLGIGREGGQLFVPSLGRLALLHALELRR